MMSVRMLYVIWARIFGYIILVVILRVNDYCNSSTYIPCIKDTDKEN